MKALASAIAAAVILVVGADGFGHAWASPAAVQIKARAGGNQRAGWGRTGWRGGPRGGWGGPRVWWGGGFGWGPRAWWGPGFYGYPAYPYAYPYAYPPAVVVQPNPQIYIEQAPPAAAPPPATAQPQAPTYWYYCAESRTYYPYVRECPDGWMTVVPPSASTP